MRLRTWLALGLGAAIGAGGVYLYDPEHGHARRRAARMRATRQARELARDLLTQGRQRAAVQGRALIEQAAEGFRTGRAG